MTAKDMVISAFNSIEKNDFTIAELMDKINIDYPGEDLKKSTVHCILNDLKLQKALTALSLRRGRHAVYGRLFKFSESPVSAADPVLTPVSDTDQPPTVANQTLNSKLSTILQVARAVIEYPGEEFTKMDILNFLRSKEETVTINEATVADYIGRALVNRNIVKVAGRRKEAPRVKVYKKGTCVVNVTKFDPIAITTILEDKNSRIEKQHGNILPGKPVRFEDLEASSEQVGESICAYIQRLQDNLTISINDRADLINRQVEQQRINDGLQEKITKMDDDHKTLLDEMIGMQSRMDTMNRELFGAPKDATGCKKEVSDLRKTLTSISEDMAEAPLSALISKAVDMAHCLKPLEGINIRHKDAMKKIETLESREKKHIEEKENLISRLLEHQKEIETLKRELNGKKGKMIVLKSFVELGQKVKEC